MLRYLWIENYKNIQSVGFSFDPTLNAAYELKTGNLQIDIDNKRLLPKHFFGEYIESVTGVLGENGAGKSSLVDFIRSVLTTPNDNGASIPKFLFIFGDSIIHSEHTKINLITGEHNEPFKVYPFEKQQNGSKWPQEVLEHKYIYYANFWENTYIHPRPNLIDVSTNYLFEHEYMDNKESDSSRDALTSYRTSNFIAEIRALTFLRSAELDSIPFSLPKKLQIEVIKPEEIPQIGDIGNAYQLLFDQEKLTFLLNSLEARVQLAKKESALNEFVAQFIQTRVQLLIRHFPNALSRLTISALNKLANFEGRLPTRIDAKLKEELKPIKIFVDFLRKTIAEQRALPLMTITANRQKSRVYLELDTENEEKGYIERIFNEITKSDNNARFLDIHWRGLSSGEAAYLRLYARINNAFENVNARVSEQFEKIRSLTFLIDEGETGFHPQWQKKYIDIILKTIDKLYKGYRIQLVICSNSPFIASDIPRSSLILLRRNESRKNCELVKWEDGETFAANIHALLTNSFFLKQGLMGDFSKNKLNELIKFLQPDDEKAAQLTKKTGTNKSESISDKDDMRAVLEMIGEPVIKLKLRQMWDSRFGIDERIDHLRKQILELEKQKENGKNQ